MLISNNGEYKLYTGEKLIEAVGETGEEEIKFYGNITPSSAYPQLKLG